MSLLSGYIGIAGIFHGDRRQYGKNAIICQRGGSGLAPAPCPTSLTRMSRPLRLELDGALYYVTARGDRREPIFEDERYRTMLLAILAKGSSAMRRCSPIAPWATISRLLRHVNGVYTQAYNRRHAKVGHLL